MISRNLGQNTAYLKGTKAVIRRKHETQSDIFLLLQGRRSRLRGRLAADPSPDRPRGLRRHGRESVDVSVGLRERSAPEGRKKLETGDFS